MPVYYLDKEHWFPPASEHEKHGVVAIGGDLHPERLLLAYTQGIFPWYGDNEPITWFAPSERMVLPPHAIKVSKSMRSLIRKNIYRLSFDTAFEEVIHNCQNVTRKEQEGTWLNDDLKTSIIDLHQAGFAHSVECWKGNDLVGGLYGVSIGDIFCGDSMFSKESNTSKLALIFLCEKLTLHNFKWIDCQVYNDHLASMGAYEITRQEFLNHLQQMPLETTLKGNWSSLFD